MPMNNRILRPLAVPGVLDFAPGAAAAYSLRNLSYTYAGPVVTVRRSTDNAEADFTASEVSDGTLAAWCGGGDGFAKQWWDQSGNARHATQATAASQPQIVDSGVLVTEGGKAAVKFDGSDDRLVATFASSQTTPLSFFVIHNATGSVSSIVASAVSLMDSTGTSSLAVYDGFRVIAHSNDGFQAFDDGTFKTTVVAATSGMRIVAAIASSATSRVFWRDGAFIGLNTDSISPTGLIYLLLGTAGNDHMTGTITEAIIYPSDQTAFRTRIEGNLAWYY